MAAYSRSTIRGAIEETPGMTMISSGIDYPVFNAAVIARAAGEEDFTAKLEAASRYYGLRGLGWSCWFCEETTGGGRFAIGRALMLAGLRKVAHHHGMIAERILPVRHRLPAFEKREVTDAGARLDFIAVCTRVFGLPGPVARDIYGADGFWNGNFRGWVGYQHGRATCIAASEADQDGVGVYSVGTIPEYRGFGYGEAITRHAIEQGALRAGCGRTMLQATRSGLRMYTRMGFEVTGRIAVYATR
jgi:ribosomal protein S18 acetylase RimI-like enzyme